MFVKICVIYIDLCLNVGEAEVILNQWSYKGKKNKVCIWSDSFWG